MRKFIGSLIESIPLSIFLIYVQTVSIDVSHDWLPPFLLAAGAAIASSAYLVRQGVILNRLSLGINLYFLSGALGLIIEWDELNQLYGHLRALGMLYWIIFVGAVTSLFSAYGFLGIQLSQQHLTRYWSAWLFAVAVLALAIAICFSSNRFWGEWFPFILLFSMRGLLQKLSCHPINGADK